MAKAPEAKAPEAVEAPVAVDLTDVNQYRKCTYISADGEEYEARIIPLPTNKGTVIKVPSILPSKYQDEVAKVGQLKIEKQMEAFAALHAEMQKSRPALKIYNEVKPLHEYKGILLHETEFRGAKVPCANLQVNLNCKTKPKQPDWRDTAKVLPQEFVGTPGAGQKGKAYFKLA